MSIDENAIIAAVLGHLTVLGYGTSANERALADYAQEPKPFGFVTGLVTVREALDDAQTDDTTTFTLHLWRESNERQEMIDDIQQLIVRIWDDTTLAGACDLCQVLDATQVKPREVDGESTYWTVDIAADLES